MKSHLVHSLVCAAVAGLIGVPMAQADPGKLTAAEFDTANKEAAATVGAIKPSNTPLSKADQTLLFEILDGCTLQLELSKLALGKVVNADVKAIAQAEVDEQSAVWAKLKDIAIAKGVELPAELSDHTEKALASLKDLNGKEADAEYLEESAVNGHVTLQDSMEKVRAQALDASLRELAVSTLPLIKVHLKVGKDQLAKGVDGAVKKE